MAEINFPTSPTDGQTHTDVINGTVWTYSTTGGWSKPLPGMSTPTPFVYGDAGNNNMSLGKEQLLITGVDNTIIGFSTNGMTTGTRNTLVGAQAGNSIESSRDNVCIGNQAARNMINAAANNNVIIGGLAAASQLSVINSVILGYAARPQGEGNINSVVIGMNANGLGSNTVVLGNDLIDATYLKGEVHSKTPSYTVATLPDPTTTPAGTLVWVTDDTTVLGGVHCSCNGIGWFLAGTSTPVT